MTDRWLAALLTVVLVSSGASIATAPGPPTVVAQETATPTEAGAGGQFRLVSTTTNVPIDGTGTLALTFVNNGDDVTNASVFVASPNESVRFGPSQNATRSVGPWASGERRTVTFDLLAEEFAETRSYPFRAVITYTAANGSRVRTTPFVFGVQPSERILLERFEVTSISSTVQVADTGTISVTIENTGPDVSDAIVSIRSLSSTIRLGRTRKATQYVGEWASNEDVTFTFEATASNDTVVTSYPFSITVSYRANGTRNRTKLETFGVVPAAEQTFALQNVRSTLRVGDKGRVTGTIRNTGPQAVQEATLVLETRTATLRPEERRYPLGTIPPDEDRAFRFDLDTLNATNAGPRELTFRVVYRDGDGTRTASDPLQATIRVGNERESFDVDPITASFANDESGVLRVQVANDAEQTLSNVTARLQVDEPLTSDDSSSYVGVLSPNESSTAAFELTVEDEAIPGRHPATVTITYETPNGERRVAGPYQVAVQVERERGPGFPVLATVAVVAALFVVAGWWWWRGT
ncbi:COG1361 S-layer family protein [Haladaptatus sp. NG-WS-4]